MSNKKILFFTTVYGKRSVGGAEAVVKELALSFSSKGYDTYVCSLRPFGCAELYKNESESQEIAHIELPLFNIFWPFSKKRRSVFEKFAWHVVDSFNPISALHVRSILKTVRPDIVSFHALAGWSLSAPFFARRYAEHVNIVLHDQYLLCLNAKRYRSRGACESRCMKCRVVRPTWLVKTAIEGAAVNGVSRYIQSTHGRYLDLRGISVIYNQFVEVDSLLSISRVRAAKINSVKRLKKRLVFGYIGRISEAKGVFLLAADRAWRDGARCLLIGGGGDEKDILRLENCLKGSDASYLGRVDRWEFFKRIDVLVVPSLWPDTAPRVVQEAAACLTPIIHTGRGGITELVPNGFGSAFSPDSAQELYRVVQTYTPDRVRKMIAARIDNETESVPVKGEGGFAEEYERFIF